jgi:hypothetical protein
VRRRRQQDHDPEEHLDVAPADDGVSGSLEEPLTLDPEQLRAEANRLRADAAEQVAALMDSAEQAAAELVTRAEQAGPSKPRLSKPRLSGRAPFWPRCRTHARRWPRLNGQRQQPL